MRYLDEVLRPDQTVNPLFNHLGIRLLHADASRAELALPFRPELLQGGGLVAGGVLATLLDEAMAHAALARLASRQEAHTATPRIATVDMHIHYLRAARPGTDLRAEARVVKSGSRVLFIEASVMNPEGQTLVKGEGAFLVLA